MAAKGLAQRGSKNGRKTRKKRGRPFTERGVAPMRYLRVHSDDWARIEAAAEIAGVSASEFVRAAALEAARSGARQSDR